MKIPWSKALAICLFIVLCGMNTSLWGQVSAFTGQDVGTPTHPGGFTNNPNGSISINGGGDDIWNNSDNFYYYYASVTGLVWEAKMKIISFEGPDQWSKVNLMVRRPNGVGNPPAGDDPHYSATSTRATGQNEIRPNWRGTRAGGSGDFTPGLQPNYPNQWVRVTRTNALFTLSHSTDGVNWTQMHSQNTATTANGFDGTAWEDPILVGVAVTAHNNTDVNGATAVISNLSVTVYPVIPPTSAGVATQISGTTNVYSYAEASFNFVATNNAQPAILYGMTYEWYKNGVRVSTNAMGPDFTFLTVPADNNAQIQAIARVNDPAFSHLSVTSSVMTLTTVPGAQIFTNGLKREFFAGATRQDVLSGSTRTGVVSLVTQADIPGGAGNNYSVRYSGYFIPPADNAYVFFVAADDDTDVFLSTDANPANKRLICQEGAWSGTRNWFTIGGAASSSTQKRSDQWSPDGGGTIPYAQGIYLLASNLYYFESVHHQGTGGDNWAVTYQTTNEVNDPNWPSLFTDGTATRLRASSNNIAVIAWAGTNLSWVVQPTNRTVFEGDNAVFHASTASDSEMAILYQWYVNGAPAGNASSLTIPVVTMLNNGAQISVVASTPVGGLSITSGPVTLTVQQAVWEPGFVRVERWNGATRQQVNLGTVGAPNFAISVPGFVMGLNNPGGQNDFARRFTGFFVPPTTGNYVFFVNGDDDTDLFISTDATPGNKRLVCQETGWSGPLTWVGVGGGSSVTQKRSDQWSPDGGLTVPWAAGIPLVAGQRYYTEMVFHQGGGGANVQATYKLVSPVFEPDPVNGSNPRMVSTNVGMNAVRCTYVAFTEQPASAAVAPFGFANFSVQGVTDSLLPVGSFIGNENLHTNNFIIYQWQKNGVDIPGATTRTLSYGPVLASDNGAVFTCRIRALGYADNALNRLWSNSLPATLTLSSQAVLETGVARVEWWSNSTRVAIQNGTAGNPHRIYSTPKMIAPSTSPLDNYANRVSGFFIPPANGNYVFFLNSDDDSDLFISTDESPANKRLVARVTGWAGSALGWQQTGGGGDTLAQRRSDQFTDPNTGTQPYTAGIPLTGGQRYYIEGVHTEGGGGDYFAATYKLISDPDPVNGDDTKILGNSLAFYAPRIPWVAFTAQPQSPPPVVSGGSSVTFSAAGTNAPSIVIGDTGNPVPWFNNPTYLQYQWYKNGTPIPGANRSTLTLSPILPSDNNAQIVCGIRALGYADNALNPIFSNSTPAVLTVVTDTVPPTISYAVTFANTNQPHFVINITFSEWMDITTLGNLANYTIAGVNITNISVASNNRTVQLLVDSLPTLPLNVTVSGVKDLSGNTITPGSTAGINSELLTFTDVGTPSFDPAYPSFVSVTANGGYLITAQGSDIWNAADGFHFAWENKTNDFDVVVRGVSQGHSDTFAKAGLMVRESLDPSSRNWTVVNTPAPDATSSVGNNSIDCGMRDTYLGASAGWKNLGGNIPPAYPNAWVRLKRTGNVLEAYSSSNMVNWVILGRYDTSTNVNGALPSEVLVGICTSAHGNDAFSVPPPATFRWYNTAEYAGYNSSFVPPTPPAQLTITRSGGNVSVSWTPAGGHLESSPAVAGPGVNWQPVGGGNPAIVPIGTGPQFFRVVNP